MGVIGGGAMGSAIVRGAVDAGVLKPAEVVIAEPDATKRAMFEELGCAVTDEARAASRAEHIVLAVKPQVFPVVAKALAPLRESTIVISIMAGLLSEKIRTALGEQAHVIRTMPNTPCQHRAGMTAIAVGAGAQPGDERFAAELFRAIGRVVTVGEDMMDAVTAVSGSGPAYVFLLAESLEQAAMQVGLDRHTARTLAYQTVHGAGVLLTADDAANADALRQAVTSPGGTTAAALEVMFEQELPQTIADAVIAARDRGRELNQG